MKSSVVDLKEITMVSDQLTNYFSRSKYEQKMNKKENIVSQPGEQVPYRINVVFKCL